MPSHQQNFKPSKLAAEICGSIAMCGQSVYGVSLSHGGINIGKTAKKTVYRMTCFLFHAFQTSPNLPCYAPPIGATRGVHQYFRACHGYYIHYVCIPAGKFMQPNQDPATVLQCVLALYIFLSYYSFSYYMHQVCIPAGKFTRQIRIQ